MISFEVVPRTIESSIEEHVLPLNSLDMALSFWRTLLLARRLPGHDERAADVAVLVEALAVLDAELARHLHRRQGATSRGSGMTTSIASRGVYFAMVSASRSPMRRRAS